MLNVFFFNSMFSFIRLYELKSQMLGKCVAENVFDVHSKFFSIFFSVLCVRSLYLLNLNYYLILNINY